MARTALRDRVVLHEAAPAATADSAKPGASWTREARRDLALIVLAERRARLRRRSR
jgi:hypothetical protein